MAMLPTTKQFLDAVALINETEASRYAAILTRLIKQLHSKGGSAFTDAEKEQLATVLAINSEKLDTLLEASSFCLEQFVYNVARVEKVASALAESGFSDEHAQAIRDVWASEAEALLVRVRNQEFGPKILDSISWDVSVQSSEDAQGRMANPTVVMELGIQSVDNPSSVNHIAVESTHEDLRGLFDNLERIQEQLDAIS